MFIVYPLIQDNFIMHLPLGIVFIFYNYFKIYLFTKYFDLMF